MSFLRQPVLVDHQIAGEIFAYSFIVQTVDVKLKEGGVMRDVPVARLTFLSEGNSNGKAEKGDSADAEPRPGEAAAGH